MLVLCLKKKEKKETDLGVDWWSGKGRYSFSYMEFSVSGIVLISVFCVLTTIMCQICSAGCNCRFWAVKNEMELLRED